MVTIEQKLTLFSKLLNQDIKEEMDEKFTQLDKEYEKRLAESKFAVDKEAAEIVDEARNRAEIKKVELLSTGKMSSKKEMAKLKEELVERFMEALEKKVISFTDSDEYLKYLKQVISSLQELSGSQNQLEVYLTQKDYDKNIDFIEEQLIGLGIAKSNLSFKMATESILGGLVIIDVKENTRIDGSISGAIEDAKEQIVEKISRTIGEVGEQIHE